MAKRRFQNKLAAIVVLLAIAPVIVIGVVLVDVNRGVLQERSQELLFAVTDDVAHASASTLDDARTQLAAVAAALADPERDVDQRLAAARALVAASGRNAVAIYDRTGARIDTIAAHGASWRGEPALPGALRARAIADGHALGEVVIVDGAPHVGLVIPIEGRGARWFAATPISLTPLGDRLLAIARHRFNGRFDAVAVVDARQRFVVHIDPERTLLPSGIAAFADISESAIRSGVLVFRDDPASETVAVLRSLPGLPWAVVAMMPRDEVYAPAVRARRLVIAAVVAATLLALGAALVWSRRTARPIRTLVQLAHDLGRRRFDRRVELRTGDELETLGHAMTTAAMELDASERKLREEATIRTQLGRYLPAQLVERIADRRAALDGGRREITVVFADIAAFTALAEREPPDRVLALLNQLFTVLIEIVFRHGGTVDKLIGDCLMAFWGAPAEQPDHARRAVAAAIDMQRWLEVANDCWETSLGLTIHVAIGVHSGEAIVGNLGSEARMEYTCVGDTVNVAARLESLARPQQILISEATRTALDPSVRCARIGRRRLPGRMAPVELHEVIL